MLLIYLGAFAFLILVIVGMYLILYDGLFNNKYVVLSRMVLVLSQADQQIAQDETDRTRRNFHTYYGGGLLIAILPSASIVYYSIINPSFNVELVLRIYFLLVILLLMYVLKTVELNPLIAEWKVILERHGQSVDQVKLDLSRWSHWMYGGRMARLEVLARSWFEINYPDYRNLYLLPTDDGEKDHSTLNTIEQLTRDLNLANLVPRNYNLPLFITGIVLLVGNIVFFSFLVSYFSDRVFPLSPTLWPALFMASLLLLISSMFYVGFIIRRHEIYNPKLAKDVLSSHDIEFTDEDYRLRLYELLLEEYPRINY